MKKKVVVLLGLSMLIVLAIVIGFRSPAQAELPSSFMIGSSHQGTGSYAFGVGFADVLQKHTGISISVTPAPGMNGVVELLRRKEVEFGVINTTHTGIAFTGAKGLEDIYKGYAKIGPVRSMRLLINGYRVPLGLLATGDIYTPKDLIGKKILAIHLGSEGTYAGVLGMLKASNIPVSKVNLLEYPDTNTGCKWVAAGKADAVHTTAIGGKITQFEFQVGKGKGRFVSLPITPEAMKIYRFYYPGVVPHTEKVGIPCVPKGTTMYAMVYNIATREGISDDLAYTVAKTIQENTEQLTAIHKRLANFTIEKTLDQLHQVPFHPGAVRYFIEKGAWTDALEKRQRQLLKE